MEPGGPTVLLGYTGLAELWGRMPMGRWLRDILQAVSQPLPDLMEHLLSQLNSKIASFIQVLIINVLVVNGPNGEERYFGGFTNTDEGFETDRAIMQRKRPPTPRWRRPTWLFSTTAPVST